MNTNNLIKASLFGLFCSINSNAFCQSVIYVGSNRAWGISWGSGNTIQQSAYNQCINNGGVNCRQVHYNRTKGYGAIAKGTNNALGWASGFPTQQAANNAAIYKCKQNGGQNVNVVGSWFDR